MTNTRFAWQYKSFFFVFFFTTLINLSYLRTQTVFVTLSHFGWFFFSFVRQAVEGIDSPPLALPPPSMKIAGVRARYARTGVRITTAGRGQSRALPTLAEVAWMRGWLCRRRRAGESIGANYACLDASHISLHLACSRPDARCEDCGE